MRINVISTIAFLLSWSPYCFVSIAVIFTKRHVITTLQAEIVELLANASVIYAPVVYTIMYSRFRATLFRILHLGRHASRMTIEDLVNISRSNRRRYVHGRQGTLQRYNDWKSLAIPAKGRK